MGKDSAARIELGRSFHQMGTVNEKVDVPINKPKLYWESYELADLKDSLLTTIWVNAEDKGTVDPGENRVLSGLRVKWC